MRSKRIGGDSVSVRVRPSVLVSKLDCDVIERIVQSLTTFHVRAYGNDLRVSRGIELGIFLSRGCGGIGRHTVFKRPRELSCAGSSPVTRIV